MKSNLWSREEFMLAMNLYTKIRYGQFHTSNSEVKKLATLINRTPGSISYKLVHFAYLDPAHTGRIKGLGKPGKPAIKIYNEFQENWNEMLFESEELLAKYQDKSVEEVSLDKDEIKQINLDILLGKEGTDIKRLVKTRVNQALFRKIIIANYSNSCAICGLDIEALMVASHILKWSENQPERLNPENGICFCSIHDKAFEIGYLGIKYLDKKEIEYKIMVSKELSHSKEKETINALFKRHENQKLILPDKFHPNPSFLEQHYDKTFKK